MTTARQTTVEAPPFEAHAKQVLMALRSAFGAVLGALPGEIRRPQDLQQVLGIDKMAAWRIMKVVNGKNLFQASQHIPGTPVLQKFLHAARQKAPENLILSAAKAIKEFERLVEVHAGDRASLDMMLAGHAGSGTEQAYLAHRKGAYQHNSFIWGVQAKTQLSATFFHPAAEKGIMDAAALRGFVDLRRIRSNLPWAIARAGCSDDDGKGLSSFVRLPLDPEGAAEKGSDGVPLLRKFCSRPLPRFRRLARREGTVDDELVEGPVGKTGAVTCITGEVWRSLGPYHRTEHNKVMRGGCPVHTACEALVLDYIVHEDLYGPISHDIALYSELGGGEYSAPERACQPLPVWESVEYLGKGPSVFYTAHVPRYAEMAEYVFDKLGWNGERFDVYRVVMPFPAVPAMLAITHELPEAPG